MKETHKVMTEIFENVKDTYDEGAMTITLWVFFEKTAELKMSLSLNAPDWSKMTKASIQPIRFRHSKSVL